MTSEAVVPGFRCSLGTQALAGQAARWRRLDASVRGRVRSEGGFEVTFDAERREEIADLVATERGCCGWADWSLREEGDAVVLAVTGPAAEMAALAAAFAA